MKIVNYRYDLSDKPEGIGISEEIQYGPISAELLGIIKFNGNNEDYLICRTKEAVNNDSNYINRLTARRVMGYDSSLFIDSSEDETTRLIEDQFKDKEHPEVTIKPLINKGYDSFIESDSITVTAIRSDIFDKKKMIIESLSGYSDDTIGKKYQ